RTLWALHRGARKRPFAGQPEDVLARLLQRPRRPEKHGCWHSLWHLKSCRFFLTKRRKTHIISGSAGGVPERLKGADCKSVGLAPTLVRIPPPPPVRPVARTDWIKVQGRRAGARADDDLG